MKKKTCRIQEKDILERESWKRNLRGRILEEESWRRNLGKEESLRRGILEEEYCKRNPRGGIILVEES